MVKKYLLTYKEVNKWFIDLLYCNLIGQNVTTMVQVYLHVAMFWVCLIMEWLPILIVKKISFSVDTSSFVYMERNVDTHTLIPCF
jgi:hypothetical protein